MRKVYEKSYGTDYCAIALDSCYAENLKLFFHQKKRAFSKMHKSNVAISKRLIKFQRIGIACEGI